MTYCPSKSVKGHLGPHLFSMKLFAAVVGGDDGGEEDNGADGSSGEGSDDGDGSTSGKDNDDGCADNTQIASSSLRQDCILKQMELFPMPNLGLCTSLPDTPPAPDPAPPATPVPAPVAPQLPPVAKAVRVNADSPARATPKRVLKARGWEGLSAQILDLDDEDPACGISNVLQNRNPLLRSNVAVTQGRL